MNSSSYCIFRLAYITELLKRDLPIAILVSVENCLINNLLKLFVCEVAPDHGLEDLEQLPIADETILVYVIDHEGN